MNDDELLRYSRQIMLPDFDIAGEGVDCGARRIGVAGQHVSRGGWCRRIVAGRS
jgi:molybdopterin/thiamine biosynthesis adenylyltransferase